MMFSIIVVALNPGDKLQRTLESIYAQTFRDYEIVLKDGGSTDGSVEACMESADGGLREKLRLYREPDRGIYDAMNQAVAHAEGELILFLNCGDLFADEKVLERTAAIAEKLRSEAVQMNSAEGQDAGAVCGRSLLQRTVLYGDTLGEKNGVVIASAPEITGFTCYRNIPCHQSCFYSADLCREKPYDLNYRIRADYDHFLWCFYRAKAKMIHLGFAVSSYEGGGYSESAENRKRDAEEHKNITCNYMARGELFKYRAIMALTLAPLRRFLAENSALSEVYHRVKEKLYRR